MSKGEGTMTVKTYLLFERSSGRIIGTHSMYDAGTRSYRARPVEEVRRVFGDFLRGKSAEQYDILEADLPPGQKHAGSSVDVKGGKLVAKPRLQVQAERAQLQGDGKDSVQIDIVVLGEGGKVVKDFTGELRVTTTRGRLSAPGGRIKGAHGRASITLTSVAETVDRVWVAVSESSGRCIPGGVSFEFV